MRQDHDGEDHDGEDHEGDDEGGGGVSKRSDRPFVFCNWPTIPYWHVRMSSCLLL